MLVDAAEDRRATFRRTLRYPDGRDFDRLFEHARHHDRSIRLVTQTVDEFFRHDVAKMILDQCAITQFHKLDGMCEEWANSFGMNSAEMRFVQDAVPSSDEKGYAEALVDVDGDWRGIEVRALPKERRVIEGESITTDVTAGRAPEITSADDDRLPLLSRLRDGVGGDP